MSDISYEEKFSLVWGMLLAALVPILILGLDMSSINNSHLFYFCIVFSAISICVTIYLLFGIYFPMAKGLKTLHESCITLSNGNFSHVVKIETNDEISQVANGLNKVIYEFNALSKEQKKIEKMAWAHANFDALTNLPNRYMLSDQLTREISKADRAGNKLALLIVDLDNFSKINGTLGHNIGNALLLEASRRLSASVRASDMVARLGDDEFAIILIEKNNANGSSKVADNIQSKMQSPFCIGDKQIFMSASIGIVLYPDDGINADILLTNANHAMHIAKSAGRNCINYFTETTQKVACEKMDMIDDLRNATAEKQFIVYYQPIIDLKTRCICKAEALIRWRHPQKGMISPAAFIPLAEETGLIVGIGDWIFREASIQLKKWKSLYCNNLQISVNMSPIQFHKASSQREMWLGHLADIGLSAQSMSIEITEGLLLGSDTGIKEKLIEFRNAGMQIAIDDFGTGYSSLSYLKKFDIDYLKIDQSFVRNLTADSSDMALAEAIIVMAHKLNLKVIAEGVETAEQRDLLIAAGCDYAQGYLFSRPVPANEFESFLLANSSH